MSIIRGEYWITPDGLFFADGDIGDTNHEGFVLQHARYHVANSLGIDLDGESDDDSFDIALEKEFGDDFSDYEDGTESFVRLKLKENFSGAELAKELKMLDAAFDRVDLRAFAMREWGWVWVRGDRATAWTLDKDQLENIASGVGDILDEENSAEPDSEELTENEIDISSEKTGKSFSITFADLEARNFSGKQSNYLLDAGSSDQVRKLDENLQNPFYRNRPE